MKKNDQKINPEENQRILVVEDNIGVLEVLDLMLKELGYETVTAHNGQSAIEKYQQHQESIKLVITDMTMPEIGGLELAETLHQINPELKLILASGYPMDESENNLQRLGIVAVIQKPLTLDSVSNAVRIALGR